MRRASSMRPVLMAVLVAALVAAVPVSVQAQVRAQPAVAEVWPSRVKQLPDGRLEYSYDLSKVKARKVTLEVSPEADDAAVSAFLKSLPARAQVVVDAKKATVIARPMSSIIPGLRERISSTAPERNGRPPTTYITVPRSGATQTTCARAACAA